MRIGIVGDTHLGCTDFSTKRRADFSAAFCNAIQTCIDRGADAICLLGDVFDSAATRRNVDAFAEILKEISPSLTRLKTANIPLVAIPGNHEFGRGREAGELTALECLGFVRVLRESEFKVGSVRICGIPWQSDATRIPEVIQRLCKPDFSGPQILLLHNFMMGSQSIQSRLWEVDPKHCESFGRTFVGHHHIYEIVGRCAIPGSTEVRDIQDKSEKCVIIYDCDADRIETYALPRTHRVLAREYDITNLAIPDLLAEIAGDLDKNGGAAGAFVYLRVCGTARASQRLSKAEILALLRERDLFDYYVDLRYSTQAKTAAESRRGASIEQVLRHSFRGGDLVKAWRYLAFEASEQLFAEIREGILSDHQKPRTR